MNETAVQQKNSPLAIASLCLGIASMVMCLGLLAGLPAVICGHMAISKIKKSDGGLTGTGMAIAGLITGYIGTVLTTIAVLGMLAGILLPATATARQHSYRAETMNDMSIIVRSCMMYSMDNDDIRPTSLNDIVPYVDSLDTFVSAVSAKEPGETNAVDQWSDYVLVPGLNEAMPAETVQAYTKPELFGNGGGIIALLDGSVNWLQGEQFRARIDALSEETQE